MDAAEISKDCSKSTARQADGQEAVTAEALIRLLDGIPQATPDACAAVAERLVENETRRRRDRWRMVLPVLAVIAALWTGGHALRQFGKVWRYPFIEPHGSDVITIRHRKPHARLPQDRSLLAVLTPEQRLLVMGNEHASSEAERWQVLCDKEPANPAYFARYVLGYCCDQQWQRHGKEPIIPPVFLTKLAKIDPDNGWFALVAAVDYAGCFKGSLELSRNHNSRNFDYTPTPEADALLDQALAWVRAALRKPVLRGYQDDMFRQSTRWLPPTTDVADQESMDMLLSRCNYPNFPSFLNFSTSDLDEVFMAGMKRCANRGDRAGFLLLLADWRRLIRAISEDAYDECDLHSARWLLTWPLTSILASAKQLGCEQEVRDLQVLDDHERKAEQRDAKLQSDWRARREEIMHSRSSYDLRYGSFNGSNEFHRDPCGLFRDEELTPGRMTDYAFYARKAVFRIMVCLGVAIVLLVISNRRQPLEIRHMSRRLADLVRLRRYSWLTLGGFLLGYAWLLLIHRYTPLGTAAWTLDAWWQVQTASQWLAFGGLTLGLPAALARARLARGCAFLGLSQRRKWCDIVALCVLAGAIPAFGLPVWCKWLWPPIWWLILRILVFVAGGVLLVRPTADALLRGNRNPLARATGRRLLLKSWCLVMLLLAGTLSLHYLEERYWVRRDGLSGVSLDPPAATRAEARIFQALRTDLFEMIKR